jgi:hypothetical protein
MICDSPRYGAGLGDKATLICRSTGNLPVVQLRDVPSRRQAMHRFGSYVRNGLPAQPVDATQALNLSAGVSNSEVLAALSSRATLFR